MTCKELFDSVSERYLPDVAGEWEARIQFNISGDAGGDWCIIVSDGAAKAETGVVDDPTATVTVDCDTWVAINTGEMEATAAFFAGQIQIDGNMADVMKMQTAFKKVGE